MTQHMLIREDDLSGRDARTLVALHLAGMHATSPPENVFALDISGLQQPGIRFWTAWFGEAIAGMGALKRLTPNLGEVKSMRTHPDHLRKGVAERLLGHIISQAKANGITRLSLETGSGPAFEPALILYRKHGFTNGEAFGDYQATDFNQFLHLDL